VFAFIEYWVAAANMAFYWTVGSDMPNEEIIVVRPSAQAKKSVDESGFNNQTDLSTANEMLNQVMSCFSYIIFIYE